MKNRLIAAEQLERFLDIYSEELQKSEHGQDFVSEIELIKLIKLALRDFEVTEKDIA